jgi:hypothetical protein
MLQIRMAGITGTLRGYLRRRIARWISPKPDRTDSYQQASRYRQKNVRPAPAAVCAT